MRSLRLTTTICALALVAGILSTVATAPQASAGGSWLYPVQDRYEQGESVTLVGYVGGGLYGSPGAEEFFAYLFKREGSGSISPRAVPLPVGELQLEPVTVGTTALYRVSITFRLPAQLSPGIYFVDYCSSACEARFGDLIGGEFHVAIDPEYPVIRGWPISEPEIANLADDATITWLGHATITAGELRERRLGIELSKKYLTCVNEAGFELVGAQVLFLSDRVTPVFVKTGLDVPAGFHGPCFEAIGGAAVAGASSYYQPLACAPELRPHAC